MQQRQHKNRTAALEHPKFACIFITIMVLIIFHYFTLWLPTLIFWFVLIPGTSRAETRAFRARRCMHTRARHASALPSTRPRTRKHACVRAFVRGAYPRRRGTQVLHVYVHIPMNACVLCVWRRGVRGSAVLHAAKWCGAKFHR